MRTALPLALVGLIVVGSEFATRSVAQVIDARPKLSVADLIEKTEPSCARIDVTLSNGKAIGSGFIAGKSNWLVTNHHVVAGAVRATAIFADGKQVEIEGVLAFDKARDVAVVQLKTEQAYQPLVLAAQSVRKGEQVVAIGAPQGLSFTASEGIVSAIRDGQELKQFGVEAVGSWLQTSTPISPGSSGGPLLNLTGQVVAANSSQLRSGQNLNFAISAADIALVLKTASAGTLKPLSTIQPLAASSGPGGELAGEGEVLVCKLPAQRKFAHRYKLGKEVDEFDQLTWFRTQWIPIRHNHPKVTACGIRVGVVQTEEIAVPLVIWEQQSTSHGFAFFGPTGRRTQFAFDGDSLELPDPKASTELIGGQWSEKMTSVLPLPHFLKLVLSKKAKVRVGEMQYELTPDILECLRELASLLPVGQTPDGEYRVERLAMEDDPSVPPALLKAHQARMKVLAEKEARLKAKEEFRTWTTADGKYTVEAKLLKLEDGNAHLLRKDDAKPLIVPLTRLSPDDRAFARDAKK